MQRSHIVAFDTKQLGVRRTTQILAARQARNKPFMMDYRVIVVVLTLFLSTCDVVKGSLKSKNGGSFDIKKSCTKCTVIRKLENKTGVEGTLFRLKCAFNGVHPSNITWLKNGKQLKGTRNIGIRVAASQGSSRLRFRKLGVRDAGLYSCVGHNSKEKYITTSGYVTVSPARGKSRGAKVKRPSKSVRDGKCELYKGTICAQYLQDNVLIFVGKDLNKSQEFIETKLAFGYKYMSANLTSSCRPAALPLWCHYHFPTCSVVNSKAEPKSICKSECNVIQNKFCKAEYEWTRKASSHQSSGDQGDDDLFPNCKKLPNEDPLQTNCVSIKRHVTSLVPGPSDKQTSGHCKVYNGGICKMKTGERVFVKDDMEIAEVEKLIINTLKTLKTSFISNQCQPYLLKLLCQLQLPVCDDSTGTPRGKPLCQDECLVLNNKFCKKEYSDVKKLSPIFFDCSSVPQYTADSGKCSAIGIPSKFLLDTDIGKVPVATRRPTFGRCQPYTGSICKKYLNKKNIYVELNNLESNIEKKLMIAMSTIESVKISPACEPFVLPLLCHHLFPYCDSSNSQPKPSYICHDDCARIQYKFCPTEYRIAEEELLTGSILFPRCKDLSLSNEKCTSLRKHFITNKTEPIPGDCYLDQGQGSEYTGFTNTTESGVPCQRWDKTSGTGMKLNFRHNYCRNPGGKKNKPWCFTLEDGPQLCNIPKCHPDNTPLNGTGEDYLGILNVTLSGKACQPWSKHEADRNWDHNFCRNPKGSKRTRPWCYVSENEKEDCDVPQILAGESPNPNSSGHSSNLLYTVTPCVGFGLFVAIIIIAVCWKKHKHGPDGIKKSTKTVTVLLPQLRTIPGENIVLPKFIGNGRFGSIYNGEIYSEDGSRVNRLVKVALKESRDDFINQAKRWSQFHHPNLLTIEAITSCGCEPMTLVYEPAGHGSLYQYLIYHSPNNPNFTKDHAPISKASLLDISRQIAAGMAYLSSHEYVHGELMTRNCQVAHSMVIKITDFMVDRDVCYYRRPNKRPIALGWMAPETFPNETLTVYSDVWAFGVLLWEIFTYGFQPYFGFTFPEVREKIINMVLLEQPRDCIPVIYELMRSCWEKNPTHRPQFVELHEDLNNLCNEFLDEEEQDSEELSITEIDL